MVESGGYRPTDRRPRTGADEVVPQIIRPVGFEPEGRGRHDGSDASFVTIRLVPIGRFEG